MITRVRIEAEADSIEQAKREIDILAKHVQLIALLEGVGAISAKPIADEHYGAKEQSGLAGHSRPEHSFAFKGRQVVQFDFNKVKEGGLKQFGFKVLDTEQPTGIKWDTTQTPWTDSFAFADVTEDHMVLEREVPATREHTWETEPVKRRQITFDGGKVVEWSSDCLVEEIAEEALKLLDPKRSEETTRWTLQLGDHAGAVINPLARVDDFLADGISVRPIPQNAKLMYDKLPKLIPLDTHKQ